MAVREQEELTGQDKRDLTNLVGVRAGEYVGKLKPDWKVWNYAAEC
jgi:hypothetical protein